MRAGRANERGLRAIGLGAIAALAVGAATRHVAADEASAVPAAPAAVAPAGAAARVVLARFSTSYAYDAAHRSRASNVELGAEAINGKVLSPGATFSFNDAVGERTAAFGYAKSVVLRDGIIAEGMGGGACQVASTLHAAALLGGLEIVLRAPHSRPSAYIRMGLDATVALGAASPAIDLKLKNTRSEAVTLHARAGRGSLEVWIDSAGGVAPEVSLTTEILERTPFPRVVERDKRAKEDTVRVKAFGIPGYRVRRIRELRAADGTVRRDVRIDVYPPTRELVVVTPTFDEARIRLRPGGDAGETSETREAREAREAEEAAFDGAPTSPPAAVVVDESAARPVLVQLRPSTRVVLDNTSR